MRSFFVNLPIRILVEFSGALNVHQQSTKSAWQIIHQKLIW